MKFTDEQGKEWETASYGYYPVESDIVAIRPIKQPEKQEYLLEFGKTEDAGLGIVCKEYELTDPQAKLMAAAVEVLLDVITHEKNDYAAMDIERLPTVRLNKAILEARNSMKEE